jgi:hypothetical protein
LVVRLLKLLSADEDLRFHLFSALSEFLGYSRLFAPALLQLNELRHVLDAVDDIDDLPVGS